MTSDEPLDTAAVDAALAYRRAEGVWPLTITGESVVEVDMERWLTELLADVQRHAEAVKSAYMCGLHEAFTSPSADPEQCWQLSAARRGLAEKGTL